jgi:hypothetical protein
MQSQMYRHTIRFRGHTCPKGSYQLQISAFDRSGQIKSHVCWAFPTYKALQMFLKTNFPMSQPATDKGDRSTLGFEDFLILSAA